MGKLADLTLDENPISFEKSSYYQAVIDECDCLQTLDHIHISKIREEVGNSKENYAKVEINEAKYSKSNLNIADNKKPLTLLDDKPKEDIILNETSSHSSQKNDESKKEDLFENLPKLMDIVKANRSSDGVENRKEEKTKSISPIKQKPSIKEKQRLYKNGSEKELEPYKLSTISKPTQPDTSKDSNDQVLDPVVVIKIIEEQFLKEVQRVEVKTY
jgi:hypothetical protein